MSQVAYSRLIETLYAAAVDDKEWPNFLRSLADYSGSRAAHLLCFDRVLNSQSFAYTVGVEATITEEKMLTFEKYYPSCPRIEKMRELSGRPIYCRQFLEEREIHESDMYKHVLTDHNIEYTLGFANEIDDEVDLVLGLFRSREEMPYADPDTETLSAVIPHIRRALRIRRKLYNEELEIRSLQSSLEALQMGVALVSSEGEVLHTNAVAGEFLERSTGLSLVGRRFFFRNKTQMAEFHETIRHFRAQRQVGNVPGRAGMAIANRDSGDDLMLIMCPFPLNSGLSRLIDGEMPAAVILLFDPRRRIETEDEVLTRMFGLTPSEARLTALLVSGMSVKQASERRGITEGTARQHLKAVFAKTGVASQQELLALVIRSAAWQVHKD
jgi:DNA-binding CsgD family transcriptional regulator/PAS domain-containing protein